MQKFLFVFAIVLSMSIGSIASAAQQSRVSRSEAGAARKGNGYDTVVGAGHGKECQRASAERNAFLGRVECEG